jgi:hypothetical protein
MACVPPNTGSAALKRPEPGRRDVDTFAKQAVMEVAATYEKLAHYTQSLRDKHDGGE